MKKLFTTLGLVAAFAAGVHAAPLGTAFTYQGRLNDGGAPANGNYDMIFNLYDDATNGTVLGTFSIFGAVPVTNGLFTVELNSYGEFGTNAFNGEARWLQIGVRTNNNDLANPWINLTPRQPLNCAPQAMFAQSASSADNANMAATVPDGAITGSKLASGAVQANNLAPGAVSWNAITGIPAGFADGVDDNTTNSAGDHQHFGSKWSGSASWGIGLGVTNTSGAFAAGVYGQQGDGSGFPYLFGSVAAGVWGESSQGSGVYGASGYENGNGVFGYAAKTNGNNAGVAGQSVSTSGAGVRGLATATTGETVGVRGESLSGDGSGVTGIASALWGDATGVYGESAAVHGVGVFGKATFVSGVGANYGVIGQSDSLWGYGVYGHAASPSGINFGVVGESHSVGGVGVVARNTNGVGLKVEGRSIIQSDGVGLKVEGSGIIQSDADSVIWIPGSASLGFNDHRTYVRRAGGPRITFPLTLPAVLYGQKTTLKSIEVSYAGESFDGDVRVTGTCVYSGDYDYPDPLVYKDNTVRYPTDYPDSYTVQLNYPLNESSPCLNLSIDAIAPAHVPDYLTFIRIYGIKLRFGHK